MTVAPSCCSALCAPGTVIGEFPSNPQRGRHLIVDSTKVKHSFIHFNFVNRKAVPTVHTITSRFSYRSWYDKKRDEHYRKSDNFCPLYCHQTLWCWVVQSLKVFFCSQNLRHRSSRYIGLYWTFLQGAVHCVYVCTKLSSNCQSEQHGLMTTC